MKPSHNLNRKVKTILTGLALVMMASTSLHAAVIGEAVLAGQGCSSTSSNKLRLIVPSQSLYSVPLNLNVLKLDDKSIERQACTVAVPISLGANEKLIVEDVSQKINIRLGSNTTAKAQLEVFLAGQQGEVISGEAESQDQIVKASIKLDRSGHILESKCGEDVLLRANESIAVIGSDVARAISDNLRLKIKVVKCR